MTVLMPAPATRRAAILSQDKAELSSALGERCHVIKGIIPSPGWGVAVNAKRIRTKKKSKCNARNGEPNQNRAGKRLERQVDLADMCLGEAARMANINLSGPLFAVAMAFN